MSDWSPAKYEAFQTFVQGRFEELWGLTEEDRSSITTFSYKQRDINIKWSIFLSGAEFAVKSWPGFHKEFFEKF